MSRAATRLHGMSDSPALLRIRHPRQGWSYYCPFVSRKDATDRILRRARAEGEEMVSDMVEKTRRWGPAPVLAVCMLFASCGVSVGRLGGWLQRPPLWHAHAPACGATAPAAAPLADRAPCHRSRRARGTRQGRDRGLQLCDRGDAE